MPKKEQAQPEAAGQEAPEIDVREIIGEMRSTVEALARENAELNAKLRSVEDKNRAEELVAPAREKLEEAVPIDALEQFLAAKINETVGQAVSKALDPIFKASRASASIDPDIALDAQKALRSDPKLNQMFNALAERDPELAGELLGRVLKKPQSVVPKEEKQAASVIRGQESESDEGDAKTLAARRDALLDYARRTRDDKGVAAQLFKGLKVWRPGEDRMTEME